MPLYAQNGVLLSGETAGSLAGSDTCCCDGDACCVNVERSTSPDGVVHPPAFVNEVLTGPYTVSTSTCPPGIPQCCSRAGAPYCFVVIQAVDGECPGGWEHTSPLGVVVAGNCYKYAPSNATGSCAGVIDIPAGAVVLGGGTLQNIEQGEWVSPCPSYGIAIGAVAPPP